LVVVRARETQLLSYVDRFANPSSDFQLKTASRRSGAEHPRGTRVRVSNVFLLSRKKIIKNGAESRREFLISLQRYSRHKSDILSLLRNEIQLRIFQKMCDAETG